MATWPAPDRRPLPAPPPLRALIRGARGVLGVMGLAVGAAGCAVPDPLPEQVWNYGLGDPRRAFESFVTAFQGGMLDAEYKCLSTGYRRRNSLSHQTYGLFREKLLEDHPLLRYGLYRSRVEEIVELDDRRALLTARIPTPFFMADLRLRVALVREDYYEARVGGREVASGFGPPGEFSLLHPEGTDPHLFLHPDDDRVLYGRLDLERSLGPAELERFDSVGLGREWRIDDFRLE